MSTISTFYLLKQCFQNSFHKNLKNSGILQMICKKVRGRLFCTVCFKLLKYLKQKQHTVWTNLCSCSCTIFSCLLFNLNPICVYLRLYCRFRVCLYEHFFYLFCKKKYLNLTLNFKAHFKVCSVHWIGRLFQKKSWFECDQSTCKNGIWHLDISQKLTFGINNF